MLNVHIALILSSEINRKNGGSTAKTVETIALEPEGSRGR